MATEVGMFNSDFMVIDKSNAMHDIEIKVSKQDLLADFKKRKHLRYELCNSYWTPNYFYFAVPEHLLEYALAKCADKKYGVMLIKESTGIVKHRYRSASQSNANRKLNWLTKYHPNKTSRIEEDGNGGFNVLSEGTEDLPWKNRVRIVKRAKPLHNKAPDNRIIKTMVARLMSEMANLRSSEYLLKSKGK